MNSIINPTPTEDAGDMRNTLYYGDNLLVLRDHIVSESVDLVYLDPPFNSSRSYNVLFKHEGHESEAQIKAFDDTWHWASAAAPYEELITHARPEVSRMIEALHDFIGPSQMMAYLVMMAVRLVELHRVLKPTGSLYLHCDPTASHYLKVVLDTIFGPQNFVSEIVWKRTLAHTHAKRWAPVHDTIFCYSKSSEFTWNALYSVHDAGHVASKYTNDDGDGRGPYALDNLTAVGVRPNLMYEWKGFPPPAKGWRYSRETMEKLDAEGLIWYPNSKDKRPRRKRYLREMKGKAADTVWLDINPLNSQATERLGYPTQKPLSLLERIISASSNPGDIVLDPFCGCGTTIAAAQKLNRTWIGIDITHLSIALLKYRLKAAFGLEERKGYAVIGEPADVASAVQLASEDRYQFQWWALSLIQAQPLGGDGESKQGKKGADRGIDGVITFIDDTTGKPKRVLVQVKSGKVNSATIRDLRGVVEREGGAIGVLITLEPPSQPMLTEAAAAGFYNTQHWGNFPKLQILTIEGLMHDRQRLQMPPQAQTSITFKQAGKEKPAKPEQPTFDLE